MGQEGTRWRLAAAAPPSRPDTPEGVPAAQLVPRWHVTNGDMLLLACFVRSVGLIEAGAAGQAPLGSICPQRGQIYPK